MKNKKGNIPDNSKGTVIEGSGKAALLQKGEVILPYKDIKNLEDMSKDIMIRKEGDK
jgi:hypothetical protein